ncbi:MAG TPA: type 1 glutamine amidotransferase domain-containing protein [Candidatus Saccharimonadales bacterium]|jgi:protease I
MDLSSKKVAVLVDNYFEQAEFEAPIDALKKAGARVTIITTNADKNLTGLHHIDKGDAFTADLLLDDANADDYDALVLPGGAINADALRMVDKAKTWVKDFLAVGKPLAVICHAPWVLVSAGMVNGRKLTSYHTIQDDIRNAGGDWADEQVVIDRTLITSRQPDDLPAFSEALISMLANR